MKMQVYFDKRGEGTMGLEEGMKVNVLSDSENKARTLCMHQ
jgi:hypothetical protein